ncbi:MAG: hypothetical protein ABSD99_00370 [Candidatus Bathyarchaeia archaeon]
MKTCFIYYPLEPILEQYEDDENKTPAARITVKTREKDYEVALFADEANSRILFFRITVPNCAEEKIPEEDLSIVQSLKEHMLSVLRITYDNRATLWEINWWTFIEEGKPRRTGIAVKEFIGGKPDFDNVRNVFVATHSIRNKLRLLTDARDPHIPLQYQYLSLYKLLESEFKSEGDFGTELNKFLDRFQEEFRNLRFSPRLLRNYIHELRDRCAHVVVGKGQAGVTQLSNKDALEVTNFLPLMIRICAIRISERYGNLGFSIKGKWVETEIENKPN